MAASAAGAWRRSSTKLFATLSALIFAVVIVVHWTTLSREHAELPLERVVADLQKSCAAMDDAAATGDAGEIVTALPPAFYGLGVWVDSPALLPGVQAALSLMKERLAGSTTAAATAAAVPLPSHTLHSFVRLQSQMRDSVVAELAKESRAGRSPNAKRVAQKLRHLASQQQLGLPTLKHAFLPEVGQEVELHGLSLFSVPVSVLPPEAAAQVQCFVTDVYQAYCVMPIEDVAPANANASHVAAAATLKPSSYRRQAASLDGEVRAALLSTVARQVGVASFRPADVAAWRGRRERQGCLYTIASVTSTLRSIAANTNMIIPRSTEHMFADLERHIRAGSFLRAARAADDLQFHPSLTPQLYIPWDHSLVSQLVVLLPMVSSSLLAVRFLVDEHRRARARAASTAVATDEKSEKKNQ